MCPRQQTPLALALILALTLACATAMRNLTSLLDDNQVAAARRLARVNSTVAFCGSAFDGVDPIPSYAGHFTVNKTLGNHLSFWFFPADDVHNPVKPLLVWLNGPGMTAMSNPFKAHGPVEINEDATGDDCLLKPRRNGSWVGTFSVLYLDNTVGAGYSYSDSGPAGFAVEKFNYTRGSFDALKQFYKLFPGYRNHSLYVGGISVAGKYALSLGRYIHVHRHGTHGINLTGLVLGAPYFHPEIMNGEIAQYAYTLGFMGKGQARRFKNSVETFFTNFKNGMHRNMTTQQVFDLIFPTNLDRRLLYNFVTRPNYEAEKALYTRAMESPSIRSALGCVGLTFEAFSTVASNKLMVDFTESRRWALRRLLDDKYKVLIYNGDFNFIFNSLMMETAIEKTDWDYKANYTGVTRTEWYGPDGIDDLRGFVTPLENLCRVVVHGAGHDAARDRPNAVLEMVEKFVTHGCVQT